MKPVKFSGKLQNFMKKYPEMSKVWDMKVDDTTAHITHLDGSKLVIEKGDYWKLENGRLIKVEIDK